VGIALLASAQDQLCHMPFERLVAALNGRKFPILNKQPDALMKVRAGLAALRLPVWQLLALPIWAVCQLMLGGLDGFARTGRAVARLTVPRGLQSSVLASHQGSTGPPVQA
jgi:hypothetical protein